MTCINVSPSELTMNGDKNASRWDTLCYQRRPHGALVTMSESSLTLGDYFIVNCVSGHTVFHSVVTSGKIMISHTYGTDLNIGRLLCSKQIFLFPPPK